MKRAALGEPEGALQRSEKAAKEGGAEPLLELLCTFTAADKARRWKGVLDGRDVVSLDDLVGLAHDTGWKGFLQELRDAKERVLASKLNAWRQRLGLREPSGGDSPGKLLARARPSYFRSLPRSKKGRVRATCFPLLCFLLALVPL